MTWLLGVKVNSRAVPEDHLAKCDVRKGQLDVNGGDIFAKACVIIDKLDEVGSEAVTKDLGRIGVSAESAQAVLMALEAPSIEALAAQVSSDSEELNEVQQLFALSVDCGFSNYLIFDASIMRGLGCCAGIVWEAFDRRGEPRAIMGGGRCNALMELHGSKKCQMPCVGFGFGDCVIVELLANCNKIPDFSQSGVDHVVCSHSDEFCGNALKTSAGLQELGCSVDLLMPAPKKKVKKCFECTNESGARRVVFVAPDEIAKGVIRVKDLSVGMDNT